MTPFRNSQNASMRASSKDDFDKTDTQDLKQFSTAGVSQVGLKPEFYHFPLASILTTSFMCRAIKDSIKNRNLYRARCRRGTRSKKVLYIRRNRTALVTIYLWRNFLTEVSPSNQKEVSFEYFNLVV